MLLTAQNITYTLPTGDILFQDVHFTLHKGEKAAIAGNNGTGKSTLLKILAGREAAYTGTVNRQSTLYEVPQHFGHYNQLSIAQALGIDQQLDALNAILNGDTREGLFDILGDNWDLPERCHQAFEKWGLPPFPLDQPLAALSGGEKTKVWLAGIDIFKPEIILLDEPTNHLDARTRQQLYDWVSTTARTLLIVSHDRQLLELCNPIWELQPQGIHAYGGNYTFYEEQKSMATAALQQRIAHQEKAWKEAKRQQQQALQRKQQDNARANKNRENAGIPKILLNTRKQAAEDSTAKLRQVQQEKVGQLQAALEKTSGTEQVSRLMKGHFAQSSLHKGKVLVKATGVQYTYPSGTTLWQTPPDLTLLSGSRLAITGANGSGKSTFLQLLMGKLLPAAGECIVTPVRCLYLDQDYTLIDRSKTVLEQAMAFNETLLETAMVKTLLVHFLFEKDSWDKSCAVLSGGEMLRLSLCSMMMQHQAPDMILLDEPTNNLDLENIKMLTQIFAAYQGTLVVVSHDAVFLQEIGITTTLALSS
ncbi:ABC-F family ATP-binding cassette domain-containing protein [Chitinophaga nivalis]|uniref:ATP-binding cassette domain-containing protein n=1 Tax=Chitinophaga nivalis TaxID=2991709 RepID=A0ABT3IJE1_9BACT|nr:ABC-F family ATP-binding cassette domain-containing protein [Chitinophaga nivalis]MCW3466224.1 ATP-binding cassette domain-containing protein [Chitinophaga nivalis]MCW3484085.1 ATP-binding cassette domain-containing protein [Chitinophaga nivalis]